MRKSILFIMLVGLLFVISCGSKKDEIEDSYLIELENQYNQDDETDIQTEIPDSLTNEDNDFTGSTVLDSGSSDNYTGTTFTSTGNRTYNNDETRTSNTDRKQVISEKSTSTYRPIEKSTSSYKPSNVQKGSYSKPRQFRSVWVDTKDSQVIKDIRLLIASRKYKEAQVYIDRLNIDNLPSTDVGHLYQFKGIVHYFLVPEDSRAFSVGIESFQKAFEETDVEKFKPLSILWLGMLYEKYSNNTVELQQAVNLFDEVINSYSNTRFVNDAVFYKALTLKKLDRDDEYNELILSLKNNTYPDNLIYSKWNNDYIKTDILLSKYAN